MGLRAWFSAAFLLTLGVSTDEFSKKFLIISAPENARVSYIMLPESGSFANVRPRTLIDTGLQHPQGLAVDQKRKRLLVADPDVMKLYAYQLIISDDGLSVDGAQTVIASNAESRWVAVDGLGNIFFSDEPSNQILKVSADRSLRGDTTPEVVYNGNSVSEVNRPGGIAVDGFHVFWTNKHFGTQAGSVVRGAEHPDPGVQPEHAIHVLAKNTEKSYGVCMALGNIFYTNEDTYLYGVRKTGTGRITEVSNRLNKPRGCVWDGDGTVYIADRGANAVYSFAGTMHTITRAELSKAFDFEDAFGLAVITGAARHFAVVTAVPLLLSVMVTLLAH